MAGGGCPTQAGSNGIGMDVGVGFAGMRREDEGEAEGGVHGGWRRRRRTADLRQHVLDEPHAAGRVEDRGEERNNEHHEPGAYTRSLQSST